MKITLAQLNPTIGDIEGNTELLKKTVEAHYLAEPQLIVFSELFLTGYPPRDLLERSSFIKETQMAIEEIQEFSRRFSQIGILFGTPMPNQTKVGKGLFNSAVLIHNGQVIFTQAKSLLPVYDVFDESRYFDAAPKIQTIRFYDEILGISICEDAWNPQEERKYEIDPILMLINQGSTILINISASPFTVTKHSERFQIFSKHIKNFGKPFVYVNQVGANDELIFDGRSLFFDASGQLSLIMPGFEESIETIDSKQIKPCEFKAPSEIETVYQALVLGIRDYMRKCGFNKALVGLSGGIDSALVLTLAAAAIGPGNLLGITMPSKYSSPGSIEDSRQLAQNLGVEFKTIQINEIVIVFEKALADSFKNTQSGLAEENLQARVRGNILMAMSNKFGYLLLSTGNKSELAVGYCTLYGDMSGGLSVISDLPKTMVYELANYINSQKETIPQVIITKAPSAELKPNQTDQDTLPEYEILDAILYDYIDQGFSRHEIRQKGYDFSTVDWVINAVNKNEYKRRQAAPGLKITSKAFGVGRRMPIAARY